MTEKISHTLSAGVVVVRKIHGDYHYLLLRAYNYWDFPKGQVEPGEEPLKAAIREAEEETTLIDLVFRWGEVFHETEPYRRDKIARYYLAESPSGEVALAVNPELGFPEHHEFRWLAYQNARALLGPRVRHVLDWSEKLIRRDENMSA
jgi:8-oxo-dGTP pyrophosphatase MutT (NUDIX family)